MLTVVLAWLILNGILIALGLVAPRVALGIVGAMSVILVVAVGAVLWPASLVWGRL